MATDRHFYGGEAPGGALTQGEISGGVYTGPGLGAFGVWKCPACATENTGELAEGCVRCASGSQKPYRVPVSPPVAGVSRDQEPTLREATDGGVRTEGPAGINVTAIAQAWAAEHPAASLAEAFVAGYALATQRAVERTIAAPPVTADVARLAPEGKPRRTIAAALRSFRDTILPAATEEIASGEWCSIEEVDQLIAQFEAEDAHE